MKIDYRVGILGAGLGSRLKANPTGVNAKPLATLDGKSLLNILLDRLRANGIDEIICALRAEQFNAEQRECLPRQAGLSYVFADTESSLHTLAELIRAAGPEHGPILFTMADTVMLPADFDRFLAFCAQLKPSENAVLLSEFVDDEKPLWVHVDPSGLVKKFGSDPGPYVTSGMYFLQPEAMRLALDLVASGTHKMRNFLSKMAETQIPIKSFVVAKTIDVDHPSDLEKAAAFLRGD